MGFASWVGLGVELAQTDRRVWVLDGDGSLLMNLGTLATISQHRPPNLVHIVLNNGLYELVGHVPIPQPEQFSITGVARESGYERVHELTTVDDANEQLSAIL